MQRLPLVLVVLALVAGAAVACSDSSVDTATASTQADTTSGGAASSDLPTYDPLSIVTLRSDTFRSGEEYTITFAGRDGYEAILIVPCEEAGEVDVAVPLYISPISRAFGPSPMTAHVNSEEFAFLANDLPELTSPPGEGLAASLGRSLMATRSALYHLETMAAVDDNDVDLEHTISMTAQQITSQQGLLDDLTANGRLILTDGTNQTTLSGDQLTQVDQILYAQYRSLLQGPVDSVDLRMADQAGSSNPLNPDWARVSEGVRTHLIGNGPGRGDSVGLRMAYQAGSSNPLNPDWDRVTQEVHAYLIANGPDRLRLVGDAMWTGASLQVPLNLRLDEQGYAAAFAAAHSGVAMAFAATAELTSGRGASDPEDCQKLADGISSMETAIKLIDVTSESGGGWGWHHWFYDDGAAYRSWNDDNQAMLDTMRSWAAPHCPDLSEPETPVNGGTTTTTTSAEGASSTTTSTTIPALAFPRTYVGGGSATWSFSYHNGSCLVGGNTMELTLNADGTVTGSYQRISPSFIIRDATGVGRETVECSDEIFTSDPIDMTGSHKPPTPGTNEAGTIVAETAVWPDWHIEGEYTPNEMTFEWEVSYAASGYEGDAPDPRVMNYVDYQLLLVDDG